MGNRTKCCLCGSCNVDILNLGEIKTCGSLHAHYYCLLLASTIKQSGDDDDGILGFLPSDILDEVKESQKRICVYCNKKGASVICNTKNCKIVFHLPCGIENDSGHQFYGRFLSNCVAHRPKQKFVKPKDVQSCPICYEIITFNCWTNVLWAPCCRKKSYFHKKCIQQMALSAGYFFKCPICNNTDIFQKTMKHFGVFIPDRDASWELEPNAFHELLYRHDECNAITCLCSRGRQYSNLGPWFIILCNTCGSQGSHMACNKLKKGQTWICTDCSLEKPPDSQSTSNSNGNQSNVSTLCVSQPSTSRLTGLPPNHISNTAENQVSTFVSEHTRKRKRHESNSSKENDNKSNGDNTYDTNERSTMIEIDSDSDVVVIEDDNEPSYKCLIAQDGSLLQVRNICKKEEQFSVQGDLEIEQEDPPSNSYNMNFVISDVRSLIETTEDDSNIKETSLENDKMLDNNQYNLYNGPMNGNLLRYTSTDDIKTQNKIVYPVTDPQEQYFIVQEVVYNRYPVCQDNERATHENIKEDDRNFNSTSENEIVVID